MSDQEIWHRVRIRCVLECLSPVHVGDGTTRTMESEEGEAASQQDGWPVKGEKRGDYEYAPFARDWRGRLSLPPATLRGSLRALCREDAGREEIFGSDPGGRETRSGLLRKLEVVRERDDPPADGDEPRTELSRHVAIDHVTGAAAAQKLYTFETVSPGTRFPLLLELRSENRGGAQLTLKRIEWFLRLLHCWDGGPRSTLGGKNSRAFGRIRLEKIESVEGIRFDALDQWFREGSEGNNPVAGLEGLFEPIDCQASKEGGRGAESLLHLGNQSPFLVHDPRWVRDKPAKGEAPLKWPGLFKEKEGGALPAWFVAECDEADFLWENEKVFIREWKAGHGKKKINGMTGEKLLEYIFDNLFLPDLEYARDASGRPVIPATALAGCFRHQARRILKTLAWHHLATPSHPSADRIADTLTGCLFGHESWQSLIGFGDGTLEDGTDASSFEHRQTFIAVDRFTGGVAEQKLYQVRAVQPGLRFAVPVWCRRPERMEDWMCGLLALVLRDLHHGRFTLGWGAHRGYGRFGLWCGEEGNLEQTIVELIQSWQEKTDTGSSALLEKWVESLNEEVEREAQEEKEAAAKGETAAGGTEEIGP